MGHLGRSNPSAPPVQTQGGGEVNLPSREGQEVGKGNALDHLRPEGWWDSRFGQQGHRKRACAHRQPERYLGEEATASTTALLQLYEVVSFP